MGRRKGSVTKKAAKAKLPRGVSKLSDPKRKKPFQVQHRDQPREFFATAEDAIARKNELLELEKNEGKAALSYSRSLHVDATEALEILPPGMKLIEAARFWKLHHPSDYASTPLEEAIDQFLAKQHESSGREPGEARTKHVQDLHTRLTPFKLSFTDRNLQDITAAQILGWMRTLKNLGPRSLENQRGALSNFFNYCKRRNLITSSPIDQIHGDDLPEVPKSKKHPISVDQANAILEHIEREHPIYLVHFALRFFLGFRSAEAEAFRWEWIQPDLDRVYIPEDTTKTRDAWSIDDVPPRFWSIVKPRLTSALGHKLTGQIPYPYRRKWDGCKASNKPGQKRRAQKGLKAELLEIAELNAWHQNTTRDTFTTLHISAYRNTQRTALITKHRNTDTLWRSYLGTLIAPEDAKPFFESV